MSTTCLASRFIVAAVALLLGPCAERAESLVSGPVAARAALGAADPPASRARLAPGFEVNLGQMDPEVQFRAHGPGYTAFLTPRETVLVFGDREPLAASPRHLLRHRDSPSLAPPSRAKRPPAVLRMQIVGANPSARAQGVDELPGTSNYFIGSDRTKWRTGVRRYAKVRYAGVYPGVDVVYYHTARGELEHDFIVAPGADPSAIRLAFEGADDVAIDAGGSVVARLGTGEVRLRPPVVYQEVAGQRVPRPGQYIVTGGAAAREIGVHVAAYDPSRPLVIDPVLVYSTYLGGSTPGPQYDFAFNTGDGIAVDAAGNAYVTGLTNTTDFPRVGALQSSIDGRLSAFVSKFDPQGRLLYSTYLGGSSAQFPAGAQGSAIAVDAQGSAYVAGVTYGDFPTTPGAFQVAFGGDVDVFVAKLAPDGASLVYSTYLGGSGAEPRDTFPGGDQIAIAVDAAGQAYVSGDTTSSDFPTLNAIQSQRAGPSALFVTKLDTQGAGLVFSTYLGGTGSREFPGKMTIDAAGSAYVPGSSDSVATFPFPCSSIGPRGRLDAFLVKLTGAGALAYCTSIGGTADDDARAVAVDTGGNAYLVGATVSVDFPLLGPLQTRLIADPFRQSAFVAKLDPSGAALVYSTYLGSTDPSVQCGVLEPESFFLTCTDQAEAVRVDRDGNAYVTGLTTTTDFPVTAGAVQSRFGGGPLDAFIVKLDPTGAVLLYSTYLGGSELDSTVDLALDANANVFVTGQTLSPDFPLEGSFQRTMSGIVDAFVTKLALPPNDPVALQLLDFPRPIPALPPVAFLGQPYVGNVGIGGGRPPYGVSVIRGALPPGLGLQGVTAAPSFARGLEGSGESCGGAELPPGSVGSSPLITGVSQQLGTQCADVCVTDPNNPQGVVRTYAITTLAPGSVGDAPTTRRLFVSRQGGGSGRVQIAATGLDCAGSCAAEYPICTALELKAVADAGSTFIGWTDAACGGARDCALSLAEDTTVTARFDVQPRLTVRLAGSGTGAVTVGTKRCEAACDTPVDPDTTVRLVAEPAAGSAFAGWEGGGCGGAAPVCEIVVREDAVVEARFDALPPAALALVAAVLPSSRSVQVGVPATALATVLATGTGTAVGCSVATATAVPAALTYQAISGAQLTGAPNTPVAIPAGGGQAFLLTLLPTAPFSPTEVELTYQCANTPPAPKIPGLNTLLLSASSDAVPDIVALVATPRGDGIVDIPGETGTGFFSVAVVNVGAPGTIEAKPDTSPAVLPVDVRICETEPATGACKTGVDAAVTRPIEAGATPTFAVFVTASGAVPFAPDRHRVSVRFRDGGGTVRGATSVAIQTR